MDSIAKNKTIPYGRQTIEEDDIQAVISVLRSDWLTGGPEVESFETEFSNYIGCQYAIAVSNGTAALHAAMACIGVGEGDEVIVPPITFVATANAVVYQRAKPVFADVNADTLLIDPRSVEQRITPRTKAIIAVDFAGQPCDYSALRKIADDNKLYLISDSCHALGAKYRDKKVGSIADISIFSFHPVKHITTGEGGMLTTQSEVFSKKIRAFRSHGITTDFRKRSETGNWFYEMQELGYNYRITDLQCALGRSQLRKADRWLERRKSLAAQYDVAFSKFEEFRPLFKSSHVEHAYHLYVIALKPNSKMSRQDLFSLLRKDGIGVNVHYIPVHLQPFYQKNFGTSPGLCPVAEEVFERIISLPLFQGMEDAELEYVINSFSGIFSKA